MIEIAQRSACIRGRPETKCALRNGAPPVSAGRPFNLPPFTTLADHFNTDKRRYGDSRYCRARNYDCVRRPHRLSLAEVDLYEESRDATRPKHPRSRNLPRYLSEAGLCRTRGVEGATL